MPWLYFKKPPLPAVEQLFCHTSTSRCIEVDAVFLLLGYPAPKTTEICGAPKKTCQKIYFSWTLVLRQIFRIIYSMHHVRRDGEVGEDLYLESTGGEVGGF